MTLSPRGPDQSYLLPCRVTRVISPRNLKLSCFQNSPGGVMRFTQLIPYRRSSWQTSRSLLALYSALMIASNPPLTRSHSPVGFKWCTPQAWLPPGCTVCSTNQSDVRISPRLPSLPDSPQAPYNLFKTHSRRQYYKEKRGVWTKR